VLNANVVNVGNMHSEATLYDYHNGY